MIEYIEIMQQYNTLMEKADTIEFNEAIKYNTFDDWDDRTKQLKKSLKKLAKTEKYNCPHKCKKKPVLAPLIEPKNLRQMEVGEMADLYKLLHYNCKCNLCVCFICRDEYEGIEKIKLEQEQVLSEDEYAEFEKKANKDKRKIRFKACNHFTTIMPCYD